MKDELKKAYDDVISSSEGLKKDGRKLYFKGCCCVFAGSFLMGCGCDLFYKAGSNSGVSEYIKLVVDKIKKDIK